MTIESNVETIERFWEARMAGDLVAIRKLVADDATYEMVGAKAFADPVMVGPGAAGPAADRLVSDFQFHHREPLTVVVDQSKAAMVNRLTVSFRGGAPVTSEVCDVFEFGETGKVTSLRQFVDTDLIHGMMTAQI